jgi:hypothetical protein
MAILNAALDDVGTGSGHVAYAGYIGFSNDWVPLSEAWAAVLRDKGLASLHTAGYLRANPPAEAADPEQHQWELIAPFARVIHEGGVFGMCVGVEHAAYNAMGQEDRHLCGRAEELAFEMFMAAITTWAHGLNPNDRVTLMVDESKSGDMRVYGVYTRFKSQNPAVARSLASISFGNDAAYAPLQAADLLGNCFHKALRSRARDPHANRSFNLLTRRLLPANERGYGEFVFDEAALRNLVQRRREDPRFLPEFA